MDIVRHMNERHQPRQSALGCLTVSVGSGVKIKFALAGAILLLSSLSADSMGVMNNLRIALPFSGFLCDNGSGGCLSGTAGYLLDNVSGRLLAR